MARVLCILCSSLILTSFSYYVKAQPQTQKLKLRPPFAGFGVLPPSSSGSEIRLRGLCRDGWEEGTSQDLYGNEIPICIKINDKSETWEEAKNTCRQDFGFLLKLDSPVKVSGNDLMSVVLSKGITNIWTGAHTENSHLIWDDITPSQLRPYNFNQSDPRPWSWVDDNPNKLSEYCGKLSVDQDEVDRKKKRKKRQIFETSESDSNDRLFGSSDSLFSINSGFDSSQSQSDGFPQASAFQEMLTRTQFNDRLAELPRAAFGIPSAQQLPGTGLSGANLQKGGLATVSPLYSQTTSNSDSDSDKDPHDLLKSVGNLGFQTNNKGHNIIPHIGAFNQGGFNQGQLFNQPNPTLASLVGSVRDQAEKLGLSSHLPTSSPTEMLETLADHLNTVGTQTKENSDAKQDVMEFLTALKQAEGNGYPDLKPHDISNVGSPGLMNGNPSEQGRVDPEMKTQNFMDSFEKLSALNQGLFNPTTASPLINAFIGQDIQNTDDSSSLSETVKDLIHDDAKTDSSQKDFSDSAKDILQKLQSGIPSHLETIESFAEKLSRTKESGLATPANNAFSENFQPADKSDDEDISKFPNIGPIPSSQFFSEKSDEMKPESVTINKSPSDNDQLAKFIDTDDGKISTDDKGKGDLPLSESDDRISDPNKSDVKESPEANHASGIELPGINSTPEDKDDDQSEKLKKSLLGIPSDDTLNKQNKKTHAIGNVDNSENEDLAIKKATVSISDDQEINLHIKTSTDDSDDMIEKLSTDDRPVVEGVVTKLNMTHNTDELVENQAVEDDSSNVIIASIVDDDHDEPVESLDSKHTNASSSSIPEHSFSDREDLGHQNEITNTLKNYLSVTGSKMDDKDDAQTSENEQISPISTNQVISRNKEKVKELSDDNDDLETKGIKSETKTLLEKKLILNESLSLTDDIGDETSLVSSDVTHEEKNENLDQDEDERHNIPNNSTSKLSNDKDADTGLQLPSTEDEDINESDQHTTESSDASQPTDYQNVMSDDEQEDHVENLLKGFKRNATESENDDDLNTRSDDVTSEKGDDEIAENVTSKNIKTKTFTDDDERVGINEILIDNDSMSEIIDRDGDTLQERETERTVDDGGGLLDNYERLLDGSRDSVASDDIRTEDVDDNVEDNDSVDAVSEINDYEFKEETENSTKRDSKDSDDGNEITEEIRDDEANETLDDMPTLSEALSPENEKMAILPVVKSQEMELSTCRQKLPSVCFSYQLEVMNRVSTCEKDWYGHILHNKCYRILQVKQNFRRAAEQCYAMGANIVKGQSNFERMFTLLAVSMDGKLFRGTKFWKQSAKEGTCQYYDETGVNDENNCDRDLNAICVKPALQTGIIANNDPASVEQKIFMLENNDTVLPCGLTSATQELPVLWFKDGLLVSTITSDDSPSPALKLDRDLVQSIRDTTNRDMSLSALQGRYWCEVWDANTFSAATLAVPTRRRSTAYDLRYSDVMTFHGSIELNMYDYKDEALFNLMDQTFPSLAAIETDLKQVFRGVVSVLRGTIDFVKGVYTHVDKVRSAPRVLEYHTYISLTRNYSVADEIDVYNRLRGLLRAVLGNAQYMSGLPGKTPVTTFRTMALQSTISCPPAELRTNNINTIAGQVFKFRHSLLGEQVVSNETCSDTDLRPAGSASCLGDFYTGAYWGDVIANDCTPIPQPVDDDEEDEDNENESAVDDFKQDIWEKTPQTDTLTEMANAPVNEQNVENITSTVAKITANAAAFSPTDISKIADVLEHSTDVEKVTEEAGRNVIKTVDKLMTMSRKEVEVANVETKAANRIIQSLEKCAEKVDMTERDNFRVITDNIALEVWMLKEDSRPVIGLAAHSDEVSPKKAFRTEDIATLFNKSQLFDANVDAAIELPKEAFMPKVKGQPARNKLTMMVFRKSKLFEMAAKSSDGRALNMEKDDISLLNSYVISASIAGKKLKDLKEKVRTIFKPLKEEGNNQNCVFWDFSLNDKKGGWSNVGCVYDGRINGREVCLCDHLTNFAVLLDFYGQEKPIHRDHELSLSIITIIGLSFSILGLALTIVSFVFFKKLRQGRAQQTLFNLAVALLCAMLVFLIGIKQTHHYWWCLISAVMLHYFVLASFMWMLMEAILQYLTFVKILGTYITRFTLKTVIPAWGLPLVPVITILSVDYTLYKGGSEYCWMSLPAFYYGFAIPISCIIVTNIIIFVITIVSIFRRGKGLRSNQKKKKVAMTNLQAAITSFILLGLSWLFGYLAISDARLPFQYIFTILNSLQGFFIFILFVVRKKKVREQWYIICCKGMDKDRVSRSLSASNSIPSSYSNGSNRSNSKLKGKDRDRSDSTKTTTSSLSSRGSLSNGFTNLGYDSSFDLPYNRRTYRNF